MKSFMVDIETMGLDFDRHDIIEIALLELDLDSKGYWIPGREYNRILHTDQKPDNEWIAETHKNLLPRCRRVPYMEPSVVRMEMLRFFKECGVEKQPKMVGKNVVQFDLSYLCHKGYLMKSDYHYRVYEMTGAVELAKAVLGSENLYERAKEAYQMVMPEGKPHEALYDCYEQTQILNGITRLLKGGYKCAG